MDNLYNDDNVNKDLNYESNKFNIEVKMDSNNVYNSNESDEDKQNLVIICSGNGGGYEIFHLFGFWTKYYMSKNVHVLLWNYQSFGDSEGSTDFNNIRNDVSRVFKKLTELNRWNKIMVHGISLGGIASTFSTSLSNNNKCIDFFMGDRTFSSIRNIVKSYYFSDVLVKLYDFFTYRLGDSYTVKDLKLNINLKKIVAFDPNDTIVSIQGSIVTGLSFENYFLKLNTLLACYSKIDRNELLILIKKELYKNDESYIISHVCSSSSYNINKNQFIELFKNLIKIYKYKEKNKIAQNDIEKIKITENLGDISMNENNDIHLSNKKSKNTYNNELKVFDEFKKSDKINSELEMNNQIENPLLNISERNNEKNIIINKIDNNNNDISKEIEFDYGRSDKKEINKYDNNENFSNLNNELNDNLNSSNVNNSCLSNFSRLNQIELSNSLVEISEYEFVERVLSCLENLESCGVNFNKTLMNSGNLEEFMNMFFTNLFNWGSFYLDNSTKTVVKLNNFENEYIMLSYVRLFKSKE